MSNNIFLNNNLDEQLLNKIFFTLINEDKWDTLFEILSLEVIDVNTKDFRGRNALFWAINKGNIVAIEKLMQLNISTEVSPNLSAINYVKEGKNSLVIGIGCTGGKHRSVTITNGLYARLKKFPYTVRMEHRDIEKDARTKGK